MRKEYDFSNSQGNPYASQLKKQITIRLDEEAIEYFKGISDEVGMPYQSLINLYLRDCALSRRKPSLAWKKAAAAKTKTARSRTAKTGDALAPRGSKVSGALIASIKDKRTLSFKYNGRRRVVEPQCLGLGAKGTELLRGHQIIGGGQPEPLFDVSRISDLVVLDKRFTDPGPNYKKGDSAMKTIFAEL